MISEKESSLSSLFSLCNDDLIKVDSNFSIFVDQLSMVASTMDSSDEEEILMSTEMIQNVFDKSNITIEWFKHVFTISELQSIILRIYSFKKCERGCVIYDDEPSPNSIIYYKEKKYEAFVKPDPKESTLQFNVYQVFFF